MFVEKERDSEFISSPMKNERTEQGSPIKSNVNHWGLRAPKATPTESINSVQRTRVKTTSKIDMIAFVAFSLIFFIFNFIYYMACL